VITVLGWLGNRTETLTGEQLRAIEQSTTIFARAELHKVLDQLAPRATVVDFTSPLTTTVRAIGDTTADCTVIASGDPSFFGITKLLLRQLGQIQLKILPGPSSVATLAARLGRPWDDLAVISLVGRDHVSALSLAKLELTNRAVRGIALLVPPNVALHALLDGLSFEEGQIKITIGTALATDDESIMTLSVAQARRWSSPSQTVVLVERTDGGHEPTMVHGARSLQIFRDDRFIADGTNFTKLEVRMSLVARLDPDRLPFQAKVLEVGAGSGMVGLTLLRLRPDLELTQLEPQSRRAAMVRQNAEALGYRTTVSEQPVETISTNFDAAIVGGGGLSALRHTLTLVPEGAPIVATYADIHRGAAAEQLLGNLSVIQVAHGAPLGNKGTRLRPQTPIYLAWRA
jgi:precorrin-6Y C5,15-methyltransferase (decarboxylating)